MIKNSPGPWKWEKQSEYSDSLTLVAADDTCILDGTAEGGDCYDCSGILEISNDADKELIAAAPEMLGMLRRIYEAEMAEPGPTPLGDKGRRELGELLARLGPK